MGRGGQFGNDDEDSGEAKGVIIRKYREYVENECRSKMGCCGHIDAVAGGGQKSIHSNTLTLVSNLPSAAIPHYW